jgi:hypothetical protein
VCLRCSIICTHRARAPAVLKGALASIWHCVVFCTVSHARGHERPFATVMCLDDPYGRHAADVAASQPHALAVKVKWLRTIRILHKLILHTSAAAAPSSAALQRAPVCLHGTLTYCIPSRAPAGECGPAHDTCLRALDWRYTANLQVMREACGRCACGAA